MALKSKIFRSNFPRNALISKAFTRRPLTSGPLCRDPLETSLLFQRFLRAATGLVSSRLHRKASFATRDLEVENRDKRGTTGGGKQGRKEEGERGEEDRKGRRGKKRSQRFFVYVNWPIVFFKGQTHSFLSSWPFIRPSFPLPLDPAGRRSEENGGKRRETGGIGDGEGGIAVIRCTETKRGGSWAEFREWTLSKGTVDAILHPPLTVHRPAGHFSLRSPLSYGYSFCEHAFISARQSNRASHHRQYLRHRHRY